MYRENIKYTCASGAFLHHVLVQIVYERKLVAISIETKLEYHMKISSVVLPNYFYA